MRRLLRAWPWRRIGWLLRRFARCSAMFRAVPCRPAFSSASECKIPICVQGIVCYDENSLQPQVFAVITDANLKNETLRPSCTLRLTQLDFEGHV